MNWQKFDKEIGTHDLEIGLIPGRLLRDSEGTIALVGHMNELGGACDDCSYGGSWVEFCDDFVDVLKGLQ